MVWRTGPDDALDQAHMSDWEREAYEFAQQHAVSRRKLLKIAGASAGSIVLAPLVAACGSASGGGSTSANGGGDLILARGQDSDTLDPQKTTLLVAHEICWQIFDSLIYLDASGHVYPGLATAWAFSPNKLTLTFKLRKNVKFHDGTPFNAAAVKFSVERWMDPKTASPTFYSAGPLKGATVIDDYTVAYHYGQAFVPVFVGLSYSYGAPISPAAVKKYGEQFGRHPVGTGPYKFVAWTADETIKLTKNPDHNWSTPFYKDTSGRPLTRGPLINNAQFQVIPEDATRIAALTSQQIDMISGTGSVPDDQVKSLEKASGIEVVQQPAVGVYYANLNTQKAPLTDVRVRQALNYAVDKNALVQLAIGGQGKPAKSIVGSAYGPYFDPTVPAYEYDPEKAKSLMAAAGQSGGFDMTYLVIQGDEFERAAQVIQEDLSKINVKMTIKALPVGEVAATADRQKPEAVFFYYTWNDPDIVRQLLGKGSALDFSWVKDPTLDTWMDQQSVTFDRAKRIALLHRIQQRVAQQAYYLMLWEGRYSVAARDYVKNIHIDTVGFIHLQELERT